MDDFLVFRNNKSSLKNDLFEIRNFLSDHLKLELKHNIQLNKCSRGIPFLGYRVFPHKKSS
jgi:Reverse transcriptase (RNA-dependent DNA polymerase).